MSDKNINLSNLPKDTKVIHADTIKVSMHTKDDTTAERLVLNVRGNEVQITRYNGSNSGVIVSINKSDEIMPMKDVNKHIEDNT